MDKKQEAIEELEKLTTRINEIVHENDFSIVSVIQTTIDDEGVVSNLCSAIVRAKDHSVMIALTALGFHAASHLSEDECEEIGNFIVAKLEANEVKGNAKSG